ncbi:hypothetical protein GQ44DRAFT_436661 [Phaeosphaeriaceae sp. PMI808]|nr:hypothetical protein GQ44DRAFT_436661 [Phaeosphaeriaceae sp. PMI808]
MASTSTKITLSIPETVGYGLLTPYSDNDTTFANNVLCPRYAENDPTSAPPSPASIESFDILDSIPWRRSYISLDNTVAESGRCIALRRRWRMYRAHFTAFFLLFTLLVAGCSVSGYLAVKQTKQEMIGR